MKSILIFFSRANENYAVGNLKVGNTEVLANRIKKLINCDLFKCEPVKEYSSNYKECVKEALFNKQNNLRPKLKQYLNNVDEYDYIIVAGPIYFGEYPYEIYSLLDNLNLENKIIMPLVTHEGSGLGNIIKILKSKYPLAIIKDGLAIKGHEVNQSNIDDILINWLKS